MDLNSEPMAETAFADVCQPILSNEPSQPVAAGGLVELGTPNLGDPVEEVRAIPLDPLQSPASLLNPLEKTTVVSIPVQATAEGTGETETGDEGATAFQKTVAENVLNSITQTFLTDVGAAEGKVAAETEAAREGTTVSVTTQQEVLEVTTVVRDLDTEVQPADKEVAAPVSDVDDPLKLAENLANSVNRIASEVLAETTAPLVWDEAAANASVDDAAPVGTLGPVVNEGSKVPTEATAPPVVDEAAVIASLAGAKVEAPAPALNEGSKILAEATAPLVLGETTVKASVADPAAVGGPAPVLIEGNSVTLVEEVVHTEAVVGTSVPGEPSSLPAGGLAGIAAKVTSSEGLPFTMEHKVIVGSAVEGSTDEAGLRGAWYSGTIDIISGKYALVEFDELLADDESTKLKEWYPIAPPWTIRLKDGSPSEDASIAADTYKRRLRPLSTLQPFGGKAGSSNSTEAVLSAGDAVEVQIDDGWWEAVVVSMNKEEVSVYYPGESVHETVGIAQVRPALTYKEGLWVVDTQKKPFTSVAPAAEEKEASKTTKKKSNKVVNKAEEKKRSALKKKPVSMKKAGTKSPAKAAKPSAATSKKSPASKITSTKSPSKKATAGTKRGAASDAATDKKAVSAKKAKSTAAELPSPSRAAAAKPSAKSSSVPASSPALSPAAKSAARSSGRKTIPTSKVVEAAEVKSEKTAGTKKAASKAPTGSTSPASAPKVGRPSSKRAQAALANGSPVTKTSGKAPASEPAKGPAGKKSNLTSAAEEPLTAHVATVLVPPGSPLPAGPVQISTPNNKRANKGKGRGAKGGVPAVLVETEVMEAGVVLTPGGGSRSTRSKGPALQGHAAVLQAHVESKLAAASEAAKEVAGKSPLLAGKSPLGTRGRQATQNETAGAEGASAAADGIASPNTAAEKKERGRKNAADKSETGAEETGEDRKKSARGGVAGKRKATESKASSGVETKEALSKRGKRAAAGVSEEAILPVRATRRTTAVTPSPTAAAKDRAAKASAGRKGRSGGK